MIKNCQKVKFISNSSICQLAIYFVIQLIPITSSQASTTIAPSSSSGFSYIPTAQGTSDLSTFSENDFDNILHGISSQVAFATTYNSNIGQRGPLPGYPVLDDIISTLSGSVSYISKSSTFTFGGFYRGSYNNYFDNSVFSGYNQGGGILVNYQGSRLTSTLRLGIDYDEGSNRDYLSALIQRTHYSSSLNSRYYLSPKTVIQASYDQNYSAVSGGVYQDTNSYNLGASALWKYSVLTEFGPGMRYTYRSGNSNNGRTSVGPTLNANYKLSQKISLASRVGMDFSTYDSGASADPTFSTQININYTASQLWGFNFSLYRDTEADPSVPGSFTEVTATRLGYVRKIRRAVFNSGVGYDIRKIDSAGKSGGIDRNYLTLDASLGMPIISNKYYTSVYARYNDQRANVASQTWDALLIGFSVSRSF